MSRTAFANLGSGWFSDVAFFNGRLYLIGGFDVPGGVEVRVYRMDPADLGTPELVMAHPIGEGYGYGRIYASDGSLWWAYHTGQIGVFERLGSDGDVALDPCQNSSPVCFGDGSFAWQGAAAEGWPVSVRRLSDGVLRERVRQGQGTGLSRVVGERVVTIDEDRLALAGATIPAFAGDLAVGEGPDGGVLWRLPDASGIVWPGTFTGTPRCAADGDLRAITTGGGPAGVRVFCGATSELRALVATGKPTEPPVVVPPIVVIPPVNVPSEEPMKIRIPQRAKAIVQELYERHTDLARGDDNQRRELTRLCAEQLAFEHPSVAVSDNGNVDVFEQVEWGTKRADGGRPPSKDALAIRRQGALWSADCFNGSTREPAVPEEFEALPGQVFIGNGDALDGGQVLRATNHLAAVPNVPDAPKPPNVPQPPSDLIARLEQLERQHLEDRDMWDEAITKLGHDVEAIKLKVEHGGEAVDLSGYAKLGAPVTVRAKVFGSTVTARGTIDVTP